MPDDGKTNELLTRLTARGWRLWTPHEWQRLQQARRDELHDYRRSGFFWGACTCLALFLIYVTTR